MLVRSGVAAVAFLLLGAFFVHGPLGAARIENLLAGRARERLEALDFGWARADADGQTILLSGEAPNADALAKALATARTAIGPGGVAFGAVTKVDAAAVSVSPPRRQTIAVADYRFEAELKNGAVTLSGFAPSMAARAALADAVGGSAFVADNTELAPIEDEAGWTDAASAALRALSMLEQGTVQTEGARFRINGSANDPATADAAAAVLAGAQAAFAFEPDIVLGEPRAASPAVAAPAPTDPAECQAALNKVLNGRSLTYHPNSVALSKSDRAFLDELAAAATGACARATVIIEGHTDSVGRASSNLSLSRRRAELVKAYLDQAGKGDLFRVEAFGETRPIASNRTREGQQRNRRIDFVVAAAAAESD